jgi:hypothetical protein
MDLSMALGIIIGELIIIMLQLFIIIHRFNKKS